MNTKLKISQCIIVKNEEANITRALQWGRDYFYEQIVVDTGSTDNTKDIVRKLGAKLYNFSWIDDFSAAKNYALEKASGDWIVFLDADEYMNQKDYEKIVHWIQKVDSLNLSLEEKPAIIRAGMIHIDDNNKPVSYGVQDRIFRNLPSLRYKNRIHEQLAFTTGQTLLHVDASKELTIFHTGYSESAYQATQKAKRNIYLLSKELQERPDDYGVIAYLIDAYVQNGEYETAKTYCRKILEDEGKGIEKEQFTTVGYHFLNMSAFQKINSSLSEIQRIYHQLHMIDAENPDLNYFTGLWMIHNGKQEEACSHFESALEKIESYKGINHIYAAGHLEQVYSLLVKICYDLDFKQKTIHYGVLGLRVNKYSEAVLSTILFLLKEEESTEAVFGFLSKLYDFEQLKDSLFVYKCSKIAGFYKLEDLLYEAFPTETKESLTAAKQSSIPVNTSNSFFLIRNHIDAKYDAWMTDIRQHSYDTLLNLQQKNLDLMKESHQPLYEKFINYFREFSFWGSLEPEQGNYEVLENRARILNEHLDEFGWLYSQLTDYHSKMILLSIVKNWTYLNYEELHNVISHSHPQYFDPDLISDGVEEVLVDIGAYTGDTVMDFVNAYGDCYKHIYCYEITPDSIEALKRNTQYYPNITVRNVGAGKEKGVFYLAPNKKDASSNTLKKEGESHIDMVSIDEDIDGPVTFIKMDIEGAEREALLGCRKTIEKHHPKLAISVYHGYEDLWEIPKMIHQMDESYRFYLRYYGGDLIPTEIVLYAL